MNKGKKISRSKKELRKILERKIKNVEAEEKAVEKACKESRLMYVQ